MSASGPVTIQWSIEQTAFTTASHFRDLIRAATVDDVQPQAILGAEVLGSKIHVSPTLIGQAVLALKGNHSVNWEDFKLTVGLTSGGVIKIVRNSTPLIAFFLLVCAWKPCLTDSDIGDLAYQMIIESSIIQKHPVASSQLCSFIKSLSGYAEELVPVDHLHNLAVEINREAPTSFDFYRTLPPEVLARILVQVFSLMCDASVDMITLSGTTGGLLLANSLLWLIPESTCLLIDGKQLGGHGSKLRVELVSEGKTELKRNTWVIKEWKEGMPTDYIVAGKENATEVLQCLYFPISIAKQFFSQLYLAPFEEPFKTRAVSAIGELSGALIILFSESASIYEPLPCCDKTDVKCARVPLLEVFPDFWMEQYQSVIKKYGWSDSTLEGQGKAETLLRPIFDKETSQTKEQLWQSIRAKSADFIQERLERALVEHEYESEVDRIFDPACYIAINAIATATCEFTSGFQRFMPPARKPYGFVESIVGPSLSSNGMRLDEYRRQAFAQALPQNTLFSPADIVISSNGYTAGIISLWERSTKKTNALTIRVCKGSIKREGFSYESIREVVGNNGDHFHEQEVEQIQVFRGNDYLGLEPRSDSDSLEIRNRMAVAGKNLELRTYLFGTGQNLMHLSWTKSIHGLVIATHVDDVSGHLKKREMALAKRYSDTLSKVYWQSLAKWGPDDLGALTILKTFENNELRFFSNGVLLEQHSKRTTSKCPKLVIVQRANSLMFSVLEAIDRFGKDSAWAIIT